MQDEAERKHLGLALLALVVLVAATRAYFALSVGGPGLNEALYHYDVARRLVGGHGFTSSSVWTYVQRPTTAPDQPSHGVWPPGQSVLLAGAFSTGAAPLRAAQGLQAVGALALVLLTFWLGLRVFDDLRVALYGALYVALNASVACHSVTADPTVWFAVFANLALVLVAGASPGALGPHALAMASAALCPYLRPEGFLLPLLVLGHWSWSARGRPGHAPGTALLLTLWLLPQAPWAWRCSAELGSFVPFGPWSSAGVATWDDMLRYRGALASAGAGSLLLAKLAALGAAARGLVVDDTLLVFPFALLALPWALRSPSARPYLAFAVLLVAGHGLCWSWAEPSGALPRAMLSLFPFASCLAVLGFRDLLMDLSTRCLRRGMETLAGHFKTARDAGLHALLAVTAAVFVFAASPGTGEVPRLFRDFERLHVALAARLDELGIPADETLMATEPFAVHHYTGRPTVVVPRDDDPTALLEAAERYGVRHVVVLDMVDARARWDAPAYRVGGGLLKLVAQGARDGRPVDVPGLRVAGFRVYELLRGGA